MILYWIHVVKLGMHYIAAWTQKSPTETAGFIKVQSFKDMERCLVLSATGHCPEASDEERNTLGCKPSRTLYKLSSKFSRSSTFSRFFSHLSWRSESCWVAAAAPSAGSFPERLALLDHMLLSHSLLFSRVPFDHFCPFERVSGHYVLHLHAYSDKRASVSILQILLE